MILKAVTRLGVLRGEELRLAWRKAGVVAVMRPNHLNLIEVNPMVLFRLALCHTASRCQDKRHDTVRCNTKYDSAKGQLHRRVSESSLSYPRYATYRHRTRDDRTPNLSNHVLSFISWS